MRRSLMLGCGSYLPEKILTNDDLAKIVDTTGEWIEQRTGIKKRHMAAAGEKTSDMATAAANKALAMAGLKGSDIDAIFLATTTPDNTFPATAVTVQDNIGMGGKGFAMDLQAVCSGFIYALATADNFIKAGQVNRALVIGAEHFTNLLDWTDRTTCVLFGDGAGAVVLEAGNDGKGTKADRGILSTHLHSEGAYRNLLYVDGGPSSTKTTGVVKMNGKEVFRHAVTRMSEAILEAMHENDVDASEVKWLVPHQANKRIIDATAEKLNLSPDQVVVTVAEHGNTSAASIPLALSVAVNDGRIQRGDLILMEAMGGGLTWGAALARW
ncbi:MAG: 3-oxoacyl-(acyl-carrier-protein) synthase [Alphaproteobacteria bacterium]|nr:3-oxoacyl-(acyl-carrier-protein) synthase [Alphaproteobacteria bacterium]